MIAALLERRVGTQLASIPGRRCAGSGGCAAATTELRLLGLAAGDRHGPRCTGPGFHRSQRLLRLVIVAFWRACSGRYPQPQAANKHARAENEQ